MKSVSTILIIVMLAGVLSHVAGVPAQEEAPPVDTMGDLSLRARNEDLDSFWLDTNSWAYSGYRQNMKTNQSRFMGGLPSYFDGKNYYSWGMNQPDMSSAPLSGGLNLNNVQINNNGTWR